jgi:hypothetical protein
MIALRIRLPFESKCLSHVPPKLYRRGRDALNRLQEAGWFRSQFKIASELFCARRGDMRRRDVASSEALFFLRGCSASIIGCNLTSVS